jgi:hypothetical protein
MEGFFVKVDAGFAFRKHDEISGTGVFPVQSKPERLWLKSDAWNLVAKINNSVPVRDLTEWALCAFRTIGCPVRVQPNIVIGVTDAEAN